MSTHPSTKFVARQLTGIERESQIIDLKREHPDWTFARLGEEVGLHENSARVAFHRGISRRLKREAATVEELVERDRAKLERIEEHLESLLFTPDQPARTVAQLAQALRSVNESKRKLLGVDAPERHVLFPGAMGAVDPGRDIPRDELEAMTDEQLVALESGHRAAVLRVIDTTAETKDEDPEPDDGAPPELDIPDPGPHATIPADLGEDRADSAPEDEGSERSE